MRNTLRASRPATLVALAATAVAVTAGGAALAATASSPAGGSIHVLGSSPGTGGGKVLITGAIGDHGTSSSVNKSGKPNSNGSYVKLSLTKGTIELNKTKLDANINHAFNSAKLNSATCSLAVIASSTLPIVNGTGLYAKISGTVHITISVGLTLPRYTSGAPAGQCNLSNAAQPTAALQVVFGSGTVSFS
jgi:hypothetical protein